MPRHPNIPKPLGFRSPFNSKTPPGATDKADAEKKRREDAEALDRLRDSRPMKPPGKR